MIKPAHHAPKNNHGIAIMNPTALQQEETGVEAGVIPENAQRVLLNSPGIVQLKKVVMQQERNGALLRATLVLLQRQVAVGVLIAALLVVKTSRGIVILRQLVFHLEGNGAMGGAVILALCALRLNHGTVQPNQNA